MTLSDWDCGLLMRALDFYLRKRGDFELSPRGLNDARALLADLALAETESINTILHMIEIA